MYVNERQSLRLLGRICNPTALSISIYNAQ